MVGHIQSRDIAKTLLNRQIGRDFDFHATWELFLDGNASMEQHKILDIVKRGISLHSKYQGECVFPQWAAVSAWLAGKMVP